MNRQLKTYHELLARCKPKVVVTKRLDCGPDARKGDADQLRETLSALGFTLDDVQAHQRALEQAGRLEALAADAEAAEQARVEALRRLEKRKDDGVLLGDDGQPIPLSVLEAEYHKATSEATKARKAAVQLEKLKHRHPVLFGVEKPKAEPAAAPSAPAPYIGKGRPRFQNKTPGVGKTGKSPVVSTA